MAFNMKRPIIKGTPLHKASIAKAKSESIVSQARVSADSSLVGAGELLGESYIPAAIDFSIDMPEMELAEGKQKTPKKPKEKKPTPKTQKPKEEEVAKIEAVSTRELPTSKKKVELQKATGTVNTTKSTDRQMDKADEHMRQQYGEDFDLNDPDTRKEYTELLENPNREGVQLHYDEKKDDWVLAGAYVSPGEVQTDKDMQSAAEKYGLRSSDMQIAEGGTWVPKEGAVSQQYGDTWQEGGWVDTPESEQYFGPGGEKISKEMSNKLSENQQSRSDKIQEKKEEKKAVDAQNLKIKERNKRIDDAKKYYGVDKLTKKQLNAYNELLIEQEQEIEIIEEDGPEVDDADYNVMEDGSIEEKRKHQEQVNRNSNTPKQQPSTTTKPVVEKTTTTPDRKPRPGDFEGTWRERQDQYKIANEEWYQAQQAKKGKSPMEMRDDRVYRLSKPDGVVRRNMIKSGYEPQ